MKKTNLIGTLCCLTFGIATTPLSLTACSPKTTTLTVTFKLDGGTIEGLTNNKLQVVKGTTFGALPTPKKPNWYFKYWKVNNKEAAMTDVIQSDVTVSAIWEQKVIDTPVITIPEEGSRTGTVVRITTENRVENTWKCSSTFTGFGITNFDPAEWEQLYVYPLFSSSADTGVENIQATINWNQSHENFESIAITFDCHNPLLTANSWSGGLLFYWGDEIIAGDVGFDMSITTDYAIAFNGLRSDGTHSTSVSIGSPAYFGEDSTSWQFKSGSNTGFTPDDLKNNLLEMNAINKSGATNVDLSFSMVFDQPPFGYSPILKVNTSGTLGAYAYTTFDIEFSWQSLPIIVLQGFTVKFSR